jgi:hypothetical protein
MTILKHIDSMLGSDQEIGDCTVAVARHHLANNRGMVFSVQTAEQQRNSVFSAIHAKML